MTNPELNVHEQENGSVRTGWEDVAALAGQMGHLESPDARKSELPRPVELY